MKKIFVSLLMVVALLISTSAFAFTGQAINSSVDLVVSDIIVTPDTPNNGEEVGFAVLVKNNGKSIFNGTVAVRVSVNDEIVAYNDKTSASLNPGESVLVNADTGLYKNTWTVSADNATVKTEVNYSNLVQETNTENNSISEIINTKDVYSATADKYLAPEDADTAADLVVTSVNPSVSTVYDEDKTFVTAVIRNLGNAPSNEMVDVTFMADGKFLETVTYIGEIAANSTVTVKTNLLWRGMFGSHKFTVRVNDTKTTSESDYDNNIAKSRTTVLDEFNPNPSEPETDIKDIDLEITDIYTEPEEYQEGEEVKLFAVVKNNGADETNGMYRVKFNLGGKTYTSDYQTTLISSDGTAIVEATDTWTAVTGEKKVTASVNDDKIIYESDFDNNSAEATIESMRGARVSYITYEAEDGYTNAEKLVSADRLAGEIAGEASGCAAVQLSDTGDYVEWTATADANAIVMRATMPDIGLTDTRTISVYLNGKKIDVMSMNTKYSWVYGNIESPNKNASSGDGFHIYDDCRVLLDQTIKMGDKIRIQKDSTDTAKWYGIDFVDLEMVAPPAEKPDNLVSIADFKLANSSVSITRAIDYALANGYKGIWIPEGDWPCETKVRLPDGIDNNATGDDRFEIAGAGMWYSRLYATSYGTDDWGNFGFNCRGKTVYYHDFMMDGMNKIRTEGGKPFANGYGKNTTIENVWIEHTTCGFWCGGAVGDFPNGTDTESKQSKNLLITDCRIRNTGADGINLSNATTNATVVNVECRSTGDDAFAMWSMETSIKSSLINENGCEGNTVKYCTAKFPWRANCYAIYGGKDNTVTDSIAVDPLTYAGIYCTDQTFQSVPCRGTTTFRRMDLIRCGGIFYDGRSFPALWIHGNGASTGGKVLCEDINILDTLYAPIKLQKANDATFRNIYVDTFGTYTTPPANPTSVCAIYVNDMDESTYTFDNVNFYNVGPKTDKFLGGNFKSEYATITNCNWDINGLK